MVAGLPARSDAARASTGGGSSSALARAYTLSAVKPNSLNRVPAGAEAPKWSRPMHLAAVADPAVPAEGHAGLDGQAAVQAGGSTLSR